MFKHQSQQQVLLQIWLRQVPKQVHHEGNLPMRREGWCVSKQRTIHRWSRPRLVLNSMSKGGELFESDVSWLTKCSTVSKILRQKDKYMKPAVKEEVTSPGKKNKIKLPDVERTLANWARNQQKKGQLITTDELRKQVQMFTSGRTDQETFTTTEWLENFQKKYFSGYEDTEAGTSHSETLDNSPVSSDGLVSPPMSAIEEIDQKYRFIGKSEDVFSFEALEYEDSPTLPHGFTSDGSMGSGTLMSPISPEMNREYVTSHYLEESQPRQRSMTLPHLAAAPPKRLISKDAPPLPVRSMTVVNDMKNISIDPRQTMKRHKSVPDIHDTEVRYSSMQPPPLPRSNEMSPISPSTSLRQDEAFLALDSIKRLL